MKKLVALASMAVLLCASASFAKKALNEEEMDLVTAAGQPSIMDIEVTTTGVSEADASTSSISEVTADIDASNLSSGNSADAAVDTTAQAGNLAADLEDILPFEFIEGQAALNLTFSDADVESFGLDIGSASSGTMTVVGTATATSDVTGASASVTAMHSDSGAVTLSVQTGSQTELRAMVVNNIVGENQIASGINIQSGAASTGAEQGNAITQSWGSSYDWTFAAGDLIATAIGVDAGDASVTQEDNSNVEQAGGDGDGDGGNALSGQVGELAGSIEKVNCILEDCHVGAEINTGGTGTGTGGETVNDSPASFSAGDITAGDGAASTSTDGYANLPLTISADKITRLRVNSHGEAVVNVSEMDSSTVTVHVDTDSQTNLAALIVNNIGGKNQVASAFNISANGGVLIGLEAGTAAVVFDSTTTGSAAYGGAQINEINQFRGTPYQQHNPYYQGD